MPIPLRADYDAVRESRDAGQTRRLLALAAIYDGATRSEAVPPDQRTASAYIFEKPPLLIVTVTFYGCIMTRYD